MSNSSPDFGAVATAIRHCEAATVAPRFRQLQDGDVEEKSPGEIVTIADRECEALLAPLLTAIADVPVVGEEAVSANPHLLNALTASSSCWLVDPIDGTTNFATGSPDYAVMVAYVHRGLTVASWIWVPSIGHMYQAELGAGATCNGETLERTPTQVPFSDLRGVIKTRFLPETVAEQIQRRSKHLGQVVSGTNCAGLDYPHLIEGKIDFLLYWRTLPWDHAPGVLLAAEAGCGAVRPDSTTYVAHSSAEGLLVAPDAAIADLAELLLSR